MGKLEDADDSRVGRGRILPRAEDIEVAEGDGLDAVDRAERAEVMLGRDLLDPVRRHGVREHGLDLGQRGSSPRPHRRRARRRPAAPSRGGQPRGLGACRGCSRRASRGGARPSRGRTRSPASVKDDVAPSDGLIDAQDVPLEDLDARFEASQMRALPRRECRGSPLRAHSPQGRSAMCDPMKPAPPVTRARMPSNT